MMHLYSAFILHCCTPKVLYNHVGGRGGGVSPQTPPVSSIHLDDATAATGQWCQCAHHTPATGGEERVIEPIKWMGIIRRPCLFLDVVVSWLHLAVTIAVSCAWAISMLKQRSWMSHVLTAGT